MNSAKTKVKSNIVWLTIFMRQIVLEGMVAGAGQIAVDEIFLQKGECYGKLLPKTC